MQYLTDQRIHSTTSYWSKDLPGEQSRATQIQRDNQHPATLTSASLHHPRHSSPRLIMLSVISNKAMPLHLVPRNTWMQGEEFRVYMPCRLAAPRSQKRQNHLLPFYSHHADIYFLTLTSGQTPRPAPGTSTSQGPRTSPPQRTRTGSGFRRPPPGPKSPGLVLMRSAARGLSGRGRAMSVGRKCGRCRPGRGRRRGSRGGGG